MGAGAAQAFPAENGGGRSVVVKSWACLNRYCLAVFDSSAGDFPPCIHCGGLKVKWVPRPVAVRSERTTNIDKTVGELQATYGDKDYRSPVRGQPMAPRANGAVGNRSQRYTPAGMPGWAADVPLDASGNFVAHCAPTGVTARISPKLDQRASAGKLGPPRPKFEAAFRPPGGVPR